MKRSVLVILADYKLRVPPLEELQNDYSINSYLDSNYSVLHVIASDSITEILSIEFSTSHRLILRPNLGYDFGSWGQAIKNEDYLKAHNDLVFVNSSLVGPLFEPHIFISKLLSLDYDVKAAVESFQIHPHFQSYLWSVESSKLFTTEIKDFLLKFIDVPANRDQAIINGELKFPSVLRDAGMSYGSIFPAGSLSPFNKNPSLDAPVRLIANGFPYIKKSLLEDLNVSHSLKRELIKVIPNIEEIIHLQT